MKLIQTLVMAALAGLCFSASAQWQWVDKDGRKVFSDRAPPSDILEKNILKRPGNKARTAIIPAEGAADAASAPAAASLPTGQASDLQKEVDAKKKQAELAELAKRKAEEERVTKAKIENCVRAKQAKATYESGVRMARTNAAGQQEILDDAARVEELKRINAVVLRDCS